MVKYYFIMQVFKHHFYMSDFKDQEDWVEHVKELYYKLWEESPYDIEMGNFTISHMKNSTFKVEYEMKKKVSDDNRLYINDLLANPYNYVCGEMDPLAKITKTPRIW